MGHGRQNCSVECLAPQIRRLGRAFTRPMAEIRGGPDELGYTPKPLYHGCGNAVGLLYATKT